MKITLCLIFALLLIGISDSFAENKASQEIKIGMLLPLSGQYASVGADNQQGVEIAKSEIDPSVSLNLIFADSKADPVQAINEFRKLIDTSNIAAAYVFRGPPGMAVNPISKSEKIPLLGGVGNKDFALSNEYAFQLWPRSDVEGEFVAQQMIAKNIHQVALLTVQDDWPVAVSNGFSKKFLSLNGKIVLDEQILPTDNDFKSLILKIKSSKADAIFANIGLNQIAVFAKQLKDLGVHLPVYANFWAGKKEVIESAPEAMEGIVYSEMATNLAPLKEALKAKFNSSPSGATVSAYVATHLIAQALKDTSSHSFFERLIAQKEINTKNGTFKIVDRFVQFPLTLRIIHNGSVDDLP